MSLKHLQFVYIMNKDFKKLILKEVILKLIKKCNSNLIKKILVLYSNKGEKKKYKSFLVYFNKILKYLYILDNVKEIKKKLLLLKKYYHIKSNFFCLKGNICFAFSTSNSLVKHFLLDTNFKLLVLKLEDFNHLYNFKKSTEYKNLYFILYKFEFCNHLYSKPIKWLTLYSVIKIFYLFEFFFFKILKCDLKLNKNNLLRVKMLLEQSFLLTLGKKYNKTKRFCFHSFKNILLILKKKKKVVLFEKC